LLCGVVANFSVKVLKVRIDLSSCKVVRCEVLDLPGIKVAALPGFGILQQRVGVSNLLHYPPATTKPLLIGYLGGKLMSKNGSVDCQQDENYCEAADDPETFVD
jgi:hypothetical protein